MRAWAGGLAIAAGVLAGCGGDDDKKKAEPTAVAVPAATAAARPPELKPVRAGRRCPVSKLRSVPERDGRGLGKGPVYALGFRSGSILDLESPRRFKSRRWGGAAVRLVLRPNVSGTLVVRGWQLDGPGIVRFDRGKTGTDVLTWAATKKTRDWQELRSHIRLTGPGCYAYIVDGPRIHQVVTFRAR